MFEEMVVWQGGVSITGSRDQRILTYALLTRHPREISDGISWYLLLLVANSSSHQTHPGWRQAQRLSVNIATYVVRAWRNVRTYHTHCTRSIETRWAGHRVRSLKLKYC